MEELIKPRKRCLKPTDPLFEEGDEFTLSHLRKQLAYDEDCEELLHTNFSEFSCLDHGCSQKFTSVHTYESHYNSNHRYVCIECKKILPSNHLLSLHIQELHDSFFKAKLEKDPTNMFQCPVEGCLSLFSDCKTRKDHVIKFHKYPANFRFGLFLMAPQKTPKKVDNAMEVDAKLVAKNKEGLPKKVCFGYGSVKAFQWNKKPKTGAKPKPESGDIDMADMQSALDEI